MLLVSVRVGKSTIHGLGAFAAEAIPKGSAVWRFTPGFDLDLELSALGRQPALFRERLLHYGYIDPTLDRYILCCDDARFINHSTAPNLATDRRAEPHGVDVALRDIAAGEELTVDYAGLEGKAPGFGPTLRGG
jgi:uncharacterized protein